MEGQYVTKRSGQKELVQIGKVQARIEKLCYGLDRANVNSFLVTQKVIAGMFPDVTTTELDTLAAEAAAYMSLTHYDYGTLAARLAVSRLHKNTTKKFSTVMENLRNYVDPKTKQAAPLISEETIAVIRKHKDLLDSFIMYSRDYDYDYFGFKTLERGYLLKINGEPAERPQQMLMRVAVGLWGENVEMAIKVYNEMSGAWYTHASPTLFNAGTPTPQLSSCFLVCMKDDSIEGIYDTLKTCSLISKSAGGIGLSIHNIRAKGSYIKGTNGTSNGVTPMLRVFNATARYVDQGGGKRKGAFAVYLEPWHADIFDFLNMRRQNGAEEMRARDLFFALWIPDLFMQRVYDNGTWTLFSADECPGLSDCWGAEFVALYEEYENAGRGRRTFPAIELWNLITEIQQEAGLPYMLFKDACNSKSNQQNLGTIKSSNLCVAGNTKILTSEGEIEISKLVNAAPRIWNGFDWADACVMKTGVNQQMMRVCFSNGSEIVCTPYHKFFVQSSDAAVTDACMFKEALKLNKICRMDAMKLVVGHRIADSMNICGLCSKAPVFVTAMHNMHERMDTYCFREPSMDMGILNGVLTGNCTEIVQYTSPEEVAVCNLASIALPKFVSADGKTFDFRRLNEVTQQVVENLNRVIDINYYPVPEAKRSNLRHRPMGIGAQGLADAFIKMRMPFESPAARQLNIDIFETIYFAALTRSCIIARRDGAYESYPGCPVSKGILQPDMWGVTPSDRWDWAGLRADIAQHGIRNSLLLAPMPTATTSQILGNTEACEALTSNLYTRRVLAGEFVVINTYLIRDLIALKLWSPQMKERLMQENGSVQGITEIPVHIRELYKTVWEIKQRRVIEMAADRGAFICQSQSMNMFLAEPTREKLTAMHFTAWRAGLKTGCYYLRSRPAVNPIKFTVDAGALQEKLYEVVKEAHDDKEAGRVDTRQQIRESPVTTLCTLADKEAGCPSCGS